LVVNRRVWGSAVADVSALRHHGPALHHFYRLNRGLCEVCLPRLG
jgi:hypothetical protein